MSTKESKKGIEIYTSRPWELVKTCFLVLTWVVLGIHLELVTPTLRILAHQTKSSMSGISAILISRNGGYVTGNLVGAITQNIVKKHPEGLISVSFLIASMVVLVTPYIHNLYFLSTIFFVQGISQGVTDLGGTSLMLTMWGDDVSTPLNVVHLGFGIGAIIANFLVKPYLGEDFSLDKSSISEAKKTSNIEIPYSITSFVCLLICIGHLIFSIREHRIRREALKNRSVDYATVSTSIINKRKEVEVVNVSQYSPRSCGNGSFNYGLLMSILWIFYMFFLCGNDQTFGKFFFEFLKTPEFEISTKGAAWGMILYWLSYSVGRLICAIVSVFVPVHIALSGLWVCGFLLALTWFIFVWLVGLTSTNLLILGAFTGFVFSPTFPLSFGFINQRLNANPLLVGLLLSGGALGSMVFQKIGGIVLDHNRKHFPSLLISCVILAIVFFVTAFIVSSIHQRKLNSKKNSMDKSDPNSVRCISEEEEQIETYLAKNEQDK